MSLYWISWYQPTKDFRPMSYPPNKNILGWWKTGESHLRESILVAMVNAISVNDAKKIIRKDWPEVTTWQFIDEKTSLDLSDRFPLTEWMTERFSNFKESNNETI